MYEFNITPYIFGIYFFGVLIIGILSLITLGILFKHAEKRSIAVGISSVYGVLFMLVFFASLRTFL